MCCVIVYLTFQSQLKWEKLIIHPNGASEEACSPSVSLRCKCALVSSGRKQPACPPNPLTKKKISVRPPAHPSPFPFIAASLLFASLPACRASERAWSTWAICWVNLTMQPQIKEFRVLFGPEWSTHPHSFPSCAASQSENRKIAKSLCHFYWLQIFIVT